MGGAGSGWTWLSWWLLRRRPRPRWFSRISGWVLGEEESGGLCLGSCFNEIGLKRQCLVV